MNMVRSAQHSSDTRHPGPARPLAAAVVLLVLAGALLTSCGSKDSGTAPVVTPESFDFTFLSPGRSVSRTFGTAGSYGYRCAVHQSLGMTGTVVVSAGSLVDSVLVRVAQNDGYTFTPATATIKPGGVIRWLRESGPSGTTLDNHTATRP